jgi:hypothetical protein
MLGKVVSVSDVINLNLLYEVSAFLLLYDGIINIAQFRAESACHGAGAFFDNSVV